MADRIILRPTWEQRLAMRTRPEGRVVMDQTWTDLLFLHWRYPAEALQSRLPRGLSIDTLDGEAWLGVVVFFMRNIRVRGLPPIPTTANFLELNLRTYVHDERGTPGVWFFSLDANSWLAVQGGRRWFGLPYWWARMNADVDSVCDRVDYRSHRRGAPEGMASRYVYEPTGSFQPALPGSLEFFLVERYVLFAEVRPGRLAMGRVFHPPYLIAEAAVPTWDPHLLQLNGLDPVDKAPAHALVSPGVSVEVSGLQPSTRRVLRPGN